jgi:hypothetical protein
VTGKNASDQPDPVLRRLRSWADEQGHNQSDIARALGVSRAAVSSWLLSLEAGGQAATGRTFRYNRQRHDVQARIAHLLGEPVESLRLLSAGVEPEAGFQAFAEPDFSPTVAPELWAAVRDVLGGVAVRGMNQTLGPSGQAGDSLRHRIAAVAETVDDVVATLVVADHRGHGVRRTLFHHLVTLFVRRPEHDVDLSDYLESRRQQVTEALNRAALPSTWEPPWRQPDVAIDHRDESMVRLGTLVAPWLSAPWPPRTGALLPPGHGGRTDTLAVIIGGPTSAAELAGGLLAHVLGAGFINDLDLVRRASDVRARRDGAGIGYFALATDWSAAPDRSFVIEHGLHMLRDGGVPGAWLFGMQAVAIDGSPSLGRALARMPELLLVIFTTPVWRRLAAWRLAAHQRGTAGSPEAEPNVLESVTAGVAATAHERRILVELAADAETWLARLDAAEATLRQLLTERSPDPSRQTITSCLDAPSDVAWLCVEDGVWQQHSGAIGERKHMVFPGHVDDFADSQIDVAVDVFMKLAERAGYTTEEDLAILLERLPSVSVTRRFAELRGARS